MSKVKILWLTEGWAYDTDKEIVPFLSRHEGYDITWLVIGKDKINDSGNYRFVKLPYSYGDFRTCGFFKRTFREVGIKDYDLIYSSFHGFPFYYHSLLSEKNKKTPIIHAAHNVIPYPVWPWKLRLAVKCEFSWLSHFQMFSKHTARWFKEHYPTKSFFYAPMVVKDFGNVRTDNYKFDESKVNLLFFGNIVGNKRLDLLIDAVTSLPENVRDKIHLNICGKCRMDEEAFIKQIGNCKAISTYFKRIPDDEILELFSKSQYLMLPYQDVAQSGPHMIAYNYNLPVIASDIPGFAERVDNGKNGFLFHVDDKLALMDAITKATQLSSEQYQDLKKNLADKVRTTYSLEAVSKRYIEYFNSIIK